MNFCRSEVTSRLIALCAFVCLGAPSIGLAQTEGDAPSQPKAAQPKAAQPKAAQPSAAGSADSGTADAGDATSAEASPADVGPVLPWDYLPYRVLVWVASEDPSVNAESLTEPLQKYLDLEFSALWQMEIADAPTTIRSAASRNMEALTYESVSSGDAVIAVKRDHPESVRIRVAQNVGEIVGKVYATQERIASVKKRGASIGNESIDGVAEKLSAVEGDELAVVGLWADKSTEAILVSRGLASSLDDPEAKLIAPPIAGSIAQAMEAYDKIFIVNVPSKRTPRMVSVVEMDTLMRHFGPVAREWSTDPQSLVSAVGRGLTRAFAPVLRIENAGQRNAQGLLRAGGLILKPDSPANIRINDVLEPMVRKNDRNGKPILIGPIDWAFLHVTETEIAVVRSEQGTGVKVGDEVVRVDDKKINLPQEIEHLLEKRAAGQQVSVEVDRGGGNMQKVTLKPGGNPLRLVYLGFSAGERRGKVIVRSVMEGSPAEGILVPGDVVVSIGETKISTVGQLSRLVVSNKGNPAVTMSVGREGGAQDVTIEPAEMSVRQRRRPNSFYMEYYSGRPGGLQGRKNNRTFRMALKVRPFGEKTLVRLHAKGDENFPLIGYEIYQKEITSRDMTFVGRTDWDGRLNVERTSDALRLLYVKNGGAVLARLPTVPGLTKKEVADISGDDMRLQAEAYIRGVQNSIIDLVAIRELFKARIRLRLKKGTPQDFEKAKTLFEALQSQPTNEKLANEMGKKQDMFIKLIGRNANQRGKVDEMFKITRDLLSKHINQRLINELEKDIIASEANGGKLPADREEEASGGGE